jgi:hypothetical protein
MSPMLERYLASSPTIAEKFSLSPTPKTTAQATVEMVNGTKAFLGQWQPSWEKKV